MDDNPTNSHTLFPHETGHHRSARERQRKGPMWGCLRLMSGCFLGVLVLVVLMLIIAPPVLQMTVTGRFIARKIEANLEARLERDVTIGRIEVERTGYFQPTKVVLHDLRIANAPGGIHPYFARVERLEIIGGIGSIWTRTFDVSRIDIINPRVNFEVYPEGAPLQHNFPRWQRAPRRPYTIYRLEFDRMFIRGGHFLFDNRRHDMVAESTAINSDITITTAENLYAGVLASPRFVFRLQDYEPVEMNLRGGFRYTPGVLALQSIALRGRGVEAFVSGRLDPLTEAVYNLQVRSNVDLERVREIFRLQPQLDGSFVMDANLRGKAGTFHLTGGWVAPAITADTYDLADAKGTLDITGERTLIDVESADYGGGTISADYRLAKYGEPYPMTVELRYKGISIEQLFADWGVENTGLRGATTGQLSYQWNKDALLDGSGTGNARLAPNAVAFSKARYPIPVGGSTDFALNRGVVTFRDGQLRTDRSRIAFSGNLRIENIVTDLRVHIDSEDFSELDRVAYNFAHAADKRDFELLGFGGSGVITGTVTGPIQEPNVVAQINGRNVRYNDVLLGAADIALRYHGPRSVLTFDRAVFSDGVGRLILTGTVAFPDRGPSPRFDLAVEAQNYPVDRAVDAVGLEFEVGSGRGTGSMTITGSPNAGTVRFADMMIRRDESELRLNGLVAWEPGEGNVRFDLDIAARSFPVSDLIAFLDLGPLPITGELTGTLHIEGPKNQLEGAGSITVRRGTIFDEPVELATADLVFDQGRLRATSVSITGPAGAITGEAEYDFTTERFSYTIQTSSLDLARLQILEGLRNLFGGRLAITSTGAGTLEQPELVVEARLLDGSIQGLNLPEGTPPPSFYLAIRDGRLIIRGSLGDIVTIEGDGAVAENLAVNGNVRITISDLARLLALSPQTASLPVTGNAVIDLDLGGELSSLEALVVDATIPTLDVRISEQQFVPQEPIRIALRNGRVVFEEFDLLYAGSVFAVTGFAEITGNKALDLNARGSIDASLLQLFVTDMRAEGLLNLQAALRGTLEQPVITGTAEMQDAQVKFTGFPQLIDDIHGTLRFRGNRVDIESVRATVGGGQVLAGGHITHSGITPDRIQITLQGRDVALRYYEGLTVEGNFNLQVTGELQRMLAQGEINVTRAVYSRDFDLQQSILNLVLSRRGIIPLVPASWQDNVLLRIDVSAPGTLAVRNNIADVTGSADLDVMGTLANPVIIGTVELDEGGTVTFQNIEYNVVRGTINFQNPFRIDPYFDVTLEGRVSGTVSELESGPIDLTVNITGTLDRITPSITSDPPTSDITFFYLFGFGGIVPGPGGEPGPGAGIVGQSLLYTSIISALGQRILPFADSFTYDPGLLDTSSTAGPKVTFEKRVSDDIRLLVVYNLDSHKSREVIEWQVTRDWTLQITRDESEREWRTEGRFRRRYRGHWTWGGRGRADEIFPLPSAEEIVSGDVAIAPLPPPTRVTPLEPGTIVRQVNIRADGAFDTAAIEQYVDIEAGEPAGRSEIQQTIKALHATGHFRDIRVEAEPMEDGVSLTFALSVHYRIGDIDIEGVGGANRRRAERQIGVRIGQVLSLNAVDDTAGEIQQELRDYGYLEATVDPETRFFRERNRAEVVFHVNEGPEARVGTVALEGELAPFTEGELISRMREQPGRTFQVPSAREDVDRIRNFLFGRDYRRADVELADYSYDEATQTVALRYRVDVGPVVKVEVEGVPRNAVRRHLPFRARDQEYSEDAIAQAAENIVESYQQRGYFNATVDTESRRENGVWTVTFHVDPGERYRLTDVTFSGNDKVSDDELEDIVATAPRGGFRRLLASLFRRPTGVTREELSEDVDALESYYRLQGFSQATVATPVVNTRPDGTMQIEFPITEGPQTIVSGVEVEGLEQVERDQLPQLRIEAGEPLNPQLVREDIIALQTFYAERGNAEVQVTVSEDRSEDNTSSVITYKIAEGPRITVDQVIVRGNTYTESEVILRISDLETENPFNYSSILEAQRNLYRLGIFQRVDVQPVVAGTSPDERDVVISVEEGRNLTISGSVGARYDRVDDADDTERNTIVPRLAGAVAHRNLFGTGRFLGLEAVWSQDEREAFLTYREPFVGRYDVPVQINVFQTEDGTVRERRVRQRGTSIEASKVAGLRTRWSAQYQYKISECLSGALCDRADIFGAVIPDLDRALLDIQISSVTPTFFWDKRDDIIDPHRGFFTSASVEYAFPLFSAEAHFAKEFVQGAWYLPVSARSVVALSARFGFIQPLRADDRGTPLDESRFIPIAERFTAGGDTSHRAFPLDLLGTLCADYELLRDEETGREIPIFHEFEGPCEATLVDINPLADAFTLAPLGGNSMFIMNAEYRFPIFSSLGGAVFADIGNVFAGSSIDFSDLRLGVGAGIRYLSPVGPLRIDIGWPLERRFYERSFNYSITLGYAF